jgi:hypothetical protein
MKGMHLALACLLFATLGLTGCATPQPPVAMDQAFWNEKQERIGIAVSEIPKPDVIMTGNQGLLDVAVNSGLAAGLRSKVETWDNSALSELPAQAARLLQEQNYSSVQLAEPVVMTELGKPPKKELGFAAADFTPLKEKHQIDKLVLFTVASIGTTRSYYGMIPTSAPVAQLVVSTLIIDLDDNRLLYFQPNTFSRAADGEWDEAPDFPNLTNAFYQALDSTQQALLAPLKNQQLSLTQQ